MTLGGLESSYPTTEGALHLLEASFDDRLTSSTPREMTWGIDNRLLTVELDRAIVWEVTTGRAVVSVQLPERIHEVVAVTASPDFTRAAALVRQEGPDGVNIDRILGIHLASADVATFEVPRSRRPFVLASDDASLIVGGDVWDSETWSHRRTVFVDAGPSGKSLPHPLREDVPFGPSGTAMLPVSGIRVHERLLAFGPRLLRYAEPHWEVSASAPSAAIRPTPGWVSVSLLSEGAPDLRFAVADPRTIVVVSPAGRFVGTLAAEFTLRSTTGVEPLRHVARTAWANRALLSDDGNVLVLSYREPARSLEEQSGSDLNGTTRHGPRGPPRLEAWDLTTQQLLWHSDIALAPEAQLTLDGRFLWEPDKADLVDLRAGRALRFGRAVRSVSPEGIALLDDHSGGTTALDLRTGRAMLAPARLSFVLGVSGDGKHFATAAPDWGLQLESWGRCARLLPPTPSGYFTSSGVLFSADSSMLVARSDGDYLLHAWDTATGSERYALRGNGTDVVLTAPLRRIQIVPSAPRTGPLSPSGVTVLDVHTGKPLAGGSETPSSPVPASSSSLAPLLTSVTASAVSPDRVLAVSATFHGDLSIATVRDARSVGRADFSVRHDFVRSIWFVDSRHFSVQTARGAVFDFEIAA